MFFKKTSVISCYHFSSSVPHSTDLFGSVTLSAVTGGSCRSLASTVPILPGIRSVRRSEAIFSICPFHSSQPYGMFSVILSSSLHLRILTVAQEIRTVNAVFVAMQS